MYKGDQHPCWTRIEATHPHRVLVGHNVSNKLSSEEGNGVPDGAVRRTDEKVPSVVFRSPCPKAPSNNEGSNTATQVTRGALSDALSSNSPRNNQGPPQFDAGTGVHTKQCYLFLY